MLILKVTIWNKTLSVKINVNFLVTCLSYFYFWESTVGIWNPTLRHVRISDPHCNRKLTECTFNLSYFTSASSENEEPEQLDFGSGGNVILGTGTSNEGRPLFFTVTHGMVTIAPTNLPAAEKLRFVLKNLMKLLYSEIKFWRIGVPTRHLSTRLLITHCRKITFSLNLSSFFHSLDTCGAREPCIVV